MRAAIFRNGEIVVDTMPEPKPARRAGAGQDAGLRHLRLRPARAQARPSHGRNVEAFPRPQADGPHRATSCSATNSAARCSITAPATAAQAESQARASVRCRRC